MSESPPSSPQHSCSEYRRQLPLLPLGSAGSAAGCTAAGLGSVRLHIGAGHLWRPQEQRFRRPVRPWRRQGERLAQHELWWVLGWCGRRRPFLNPRTPSSPLPAPHSSAPSPPLALSGPFFHVPFAQPPGFVFFSALDPSASTPPPFASSLRVLLSSIRIPHHVLCCQHPALFCPGASLPASSLPHIR